jgi:hypothetical protein
VLDGRFDEYADVRVHRRLTALAGHDAAVASLRALGGEAAGFGITTIQAMGNSLPAADLPALLAEAKTSIRWRIIRFPIAVSERDSPAELQTVLRRALNTGDQPVFHSVGDRGIDLLLSTMEQLAPAERWQRLRVRIEHGEFLTRDRLARAKRLGIVNVQNPAHFRIPDIMLARFGAARAATAEPVKSILAVLTQDIFTVDANALPATAAAMTIVNGRIVRDTLSKR